MKLYLFAALFLISTSVFSGGGSPVAPTPSPINTPSSTACTDYSITSNQPALSGPAQKSFRSIGNRVLSSWYTPYHMAYDELVNVNESTTFTAKFDYDWVLHKDLEGEDVHAYIYGTGMNDWEYLGEYVTNSDGQIFVPVSGRSVGDYNIRFVVEGDLSTADAYLSVRENNHQAILFDIDGTLTLNDAEQIGDYLGISTADAFYFAKETVQEYSEKGYQLIFLTARPYWMVSGTRFWLRNTLEQADWNLRANEDGEIFTTFSGHAEYKAAYIRELQAQGLDIVRVYGNASTDIEAYEMAGIPKADTYIIGPNAGDAGTQSVGSDYAAHFSNIVVNTPDATCK